MKPDSRQHRRRGMSLLEVLVALAIFLISIVAISQIINLAAEQALVVQDQARATQLCQAKMAEVSAGVMPFQGQSEVPFDEDDGWVWSMECQPGPVASLWAVTIRVSRAGTAGEARSEVSLCQFVLDPAARGSATEAMASATTTTPTDPAAASSTDPAAQPSQQPSTPSQPMSPGGSGNSGRPPSAGGGPSSGGSGRPPGGGSSTRPPSGGGGSTPGGGGSTPGGGGTTPPGGGGITPPAGGSTTPPGGGGITPPGGGGGPSQPTDPMGTGRPMGGGRP